MRLAGLPLGGAPEPLDTPAGYFALSPGEAEPELLALGGEGRRALVLSAGASLSQAMGAPAPGARLHFALGRPEQDLEPGEDLVLEVRLLDAEGGVRSALQRLPVDAAPSWQARSIALRPEDRRVEFGLNGARSGERVWLAEPAVRTPGRRGPRVLLVTSDTHRADHLASQPRAVDVLTPTLDALAALFSDCLTPTNITNPSLMSLLTGAHPRDHGVLSNREPLGASEATLAEGFAEAGFATLALVSAQHLGHPESGLGQGFERMSWPVDAAERPVPETLGRARRWLDELGDEPAFLWVHLFDAHRPNRAPARWRERYWEPGRDPTAGALPSGVEAEVLPETYRDVTDLEYLRSLHRSEVSFLDEEPAAFFAHEALGDAVLAFTADHAESLGQHGIHFGHAGLFPDTLHVALLLAWPGGPRGVVRDQAVTQLDLGATLLDLAELQPGAWPGRSSRALDEGAAAGAEAPRYGLAGHGFAASLTHAGWHLTLQLRDDMSERFGKHALRLDERRSDPECLDELSATQPERARAMRAQLLRWLSTRRPLGWRTEAGAAAEASVDTVAAAEREARLAALGYLAQSSAADERLFEEDDCAHCRRWGDPP